MKDFFVIAGPCVVENYEMLETVAETMIPICQNANVKYYFKASYRKANRTSANSFSGIGDEKALDFLKQIKTKYKVEVLTDIHTAEEAKLAAQFVDVLQIPAFLARQSDLLYAAGETGKIVNIKKAQFMAPQDMQKAADKVASTGNKNIWLTERGTFFGYNNLVVDFRSLVIMKEFGYPVVYDATHSVQQPSIGAESGGQPQFIYALAAAAAAVGIDGLFFETHPNPKEAKSDAATQMELSKAESFLNKIMKIVEASK